MTGRRHDWRSDVALAAACGEARPLHPDFELVDLSIERRG
jgi:hypothetical protein